ncbi:hypothetical protein [Ruminococcus sp.]|uniref:hypothetical protein n=1 Tax=Ruminococcus sp. TaxID=41978 RepID=UPI0025D62EB3|nr:hypothetical protein [Ruminococcus sp.]
MPHIAQERYSTLVDEKLRATLVTKDNLIFNNRYEGDPKAGKVKVPVRDTEVEVKAYNKQTGATLSNGSTSYFDINIDVDEAVNELIDGFDAESVPDGITAERLDSAGYSLGLSMDTKSIRALEKTTGTTVAASKTAVTETTAYKAVLAAKRTQSRMGVPNDGKRWLIASPEFMEVLMTDDRFIKQGDLSQELVQSGVVGRIAGYNVFESNNTMFEDTELVAGKKTTTEFICGHPNWCHRVQEWSVPVEIKNLTNNYIGSSAVQGRKVYGIGISKPKTVYVKRVEA